MRELHQLSLDSSERSDLMLAADRWRTMESLIQRPSLRNPKEEI